MASLTVENYLKAILLAASEAGTDSVSTGALAATLQVTPGTVTSMLKTLSESGLVSYKPYLGASLTRAGKGLALRVLRRHRLLELFLAKTLDLSWDQVHEEAERMEHAVSDALIDRIDQFLGHPETDPHGDPIPSADGNMRNAAVTAASIPLTRCPAGARVKLVRVVNQQSDFLRYLTESHLELGAVVTVEQSSEAAGIVTLKLVDRSVSFGFSAAEQLLVETVD